jgi:hypothetical protein
MNNPEASGFINQTTLIISNLWKTGELEMHWMHALVCGMDGLGAGIAGPDGTTKVVDDQLERERHVEGKVQHLGLDGSAVGRPATPCTSEQHFILLSLICTSFSRM